jgi:hypothetical protein
MSRRQQITFNRSAAFVHRDDFCEVAEVEPKARANSAMSEILTKDLFLASYRVSDALPPRQTGPS